MINFYDSYQILSKVYSDGAFLKQAILSTEIEFINKPKTIKICYGVLDKDIELSYYIEKLCEKQPKLKIRIILKIGMYAIKYLQNKPYAVIDSLVELTKKLGKSANAGFVNATLRKFVNANIPLPYDKLQNLAIKYSYPLFAVKKLVNTYGYSTAEEIMSFDKEYTFIRFNKGIDGERYLIEHSLSYEKTPFDNFFSVPNKKLDEDFEKGIYTFQSIGSVAICDIVKGDSSLLDTCSAPGGKSVLLADKFERVTALELHEHRVELIKSYAERMGKKNITAICNDSTIFNECLGLFSAVLCDVPCSGYGTLKNNPDIKLNRTLDSISDLNKTQLDILKTSSKYVQLGGQLVYSTCSIFKEENDIIISKFLKNNSDFEINYVSSNLENIRTEYGLQFLPNMSKGAGFYVASFTRIK